MNFSNHLIQSSSLVEYSESGDLIGIVKNMDLRVRQIIQIYETVGTQLLHQFSFPDQITSLQWSPDSQYILVSCCKRGIAIVRSLSDSDWSCKIDEGLAGLQSAKWIPDSRQIYTVCDFQLRLTIWNLTDQSVHYIKNPKHAHKAISFTKDGKFMALAQRKEDYDNLSIYYCSDWQIVKQFIIETEDIDDLAWSHDSTSIICWDNAVNCRLLVYSLTNGLIAQHQPYQNALGYKTIQFSQCGKYLSGGCYDQKVRLYNHITWNEIISFDHNKQTIIENNNIQIFKEQEEKEGNPYCHDEKSTTRYRMQTTPYRINNYTDKQIGVSQVTWSADSTLLATKNDNNPNYVWIWDMSKLELISILDHLLPVKSMQWSPKTIHLVIATGSPRIYIWSRGGASICDIPYDTFEYNVMRIKWSPTGQSLLVLDKVSQLIRIM